MTQPESEILTFEQEKKNTLKAIQKKLTSFSKAIAKAQEQLKRSHEFEQVQHMAELLKAHFPHIKRGMEEITLPDWKQDNSDVTISLDPTLTPQELMSDMFRKSQKLKRAAAPLKEFLLKLDRDIRLWNDARSKVETVKDIHELKMLQATLGLYREKSLVEKKKALPYHRFHSESGLEILVGKNATSNDALTFQVAHGTDLWLHAHAQSGAHVVIRKKGGHPVDPEALQDALQLALYHSKARALGGAHEVLVTERKFVSRLPRTPKGKVVVSKHKSISVTLDKERLEAIKQRK